MAKADLTAQRLRELLHYDPETGAFTRRIASGPKNQWAAGTAAGWIDKGSGYRRLCLDRVEYKAHRVAWMYVHGKWPTEKIDHRDGNPGNNRIDNLREASHSFNMQNKRAAQANNGTGFLGVSKRGPGRFCAQIKDGDRKRYLGTFPTPEQAHAAYIAAKRRLHEGCTI